MKKDQLKKAYGEPTNGFHHSVMNALYHLDDKKCKTYKSNKVMKVALVFATVAAFGTFAVAAAATSFFGLFAQPVGQYGMNVRTNEDSHAADENNYTYANDIRISASYIPEGYVNTSKSEKALFIHKDKSYYNDNWYFDASVYEAKDFNITELNVEEKTELKDNGHKIVIVRVNSSGNTRGLSYNAYKYFDNEQAVVKVSFKGMTKTGDVVSPEYDDVVKIIKGISITQGTVSESYSYDDSNYEPGVAADYDSYDYLINGNYSVVSVGSESAATVADYDESGKNISIRFSNVKELRNLSGLDKNCFLKVTDDTTLADKFFDSDDKLIEEFDYEVIDDIGDGINSLTKSHKEKYHRHFSLVQLDITADEDISDLNKVLNVGAFSMKDNSPSKNNIDLIYNSIKTPQSVAKGETVTLTFGIITTEEEPGTDYFQVFTVNDEAGKADLFLLEFMICLSKFFDYGSKLEQDTEELI